MKRPTNDDDDGGLDSLLDTMTNVVGILVLVLIVTQMSVSEVVSRIRAETDVDAEKLQQVRLELEEKEQERDDLERLLVAPDEIDVEKQLEELQKKQELLARLKRQREEKQKAQNEFAMKLEAERKKADEAKKKVDDAEGQRKRISQLISTSLERKAEVEALLDKTPVRSAPPDIKVSIPNPRPAPPGAKQAVFLCWANSLYPINAEAFRERAQARAKAIVQRLNLDGDKENGIDPSKFTPHWVKLKDQDAFFDVEYSVSGNRHLRMKFHPREKRGAVATALVNPRSTINRNYLSALDVSKYYARFYVLPDSYEIYLTARRIFQESNMLVGWEPQPESWQYETWVGAVELGPPLPPNPNPPPPAKPANVID